MNILKVSISITDETGLLKYIDINLSSDLHNEERYNICQRLNEVSSNLHTLLHNIRVIGLEETGCELSV